MEIKSKGYDYFDVERNLQIAVDDGKVIRVISYAMSSDVENTLDKIISRILDKYNRPDLKSLVYTCTKELAINGTKANLKRIFFLENGLNISMTEDYERGMELYKSIMNNIIFDIIIKDIIEYDVCNVFKIAYTNSLLIVFSSM